MARHDMDATISALKADLRWHASLLVWALNRCQSTPQALLQLIKDGSHERLQKHGAFVDKVEEEEEARDLQRDDA